MFEWKGYTSPINNILLITKIDSNIPELDYRSMQKF